VELNNFLNDIDQYLLAEALKDSVKSISNYKPLNKITRKSKAIIIIKKYYLMKL
jgi:hypothetical protein